jgi:hypothetical protein
MWKSMKEAWDYYRHPDMPSGPRVNRSVHGEDNTVDFYNDDTYLYSYLPNGDTVTNGPYIDTSRHGLWTEQGEY